MCIIIYKPENQTVPKDILEESWFNNPDGGGFMYPDGNKLIIKKPYFDFDQFYNDYIKYENYPVVIHFRISTSGRNDKLNTHPHRINPKLGFVHNGIFSGLGNKHYSDTVELTRKLQTFPKSFWADKNYQFFLDNYFIQNHSKGILMNNSGKIYIINEKAGTWDKGIWYSNTTYKAYSNLVKYTYDWDTSAPYKCNKQYHVDKAGKFTVDDSCELCGEDIATRFLNYYGEIYNVCSECYELESEYQKTYNDTLS